MKSKGNIFPSPTTSKSSPLYIKCKCTAQSPVLIPAAEYGQNTQNVQKTILHISNTQIQVYPQKLHLSCPELCACDTHQHPFDFILYI
mmetsp:Transcript_6673/g.9036  ORF Transcript_6673/g.9036 Transcript_6673/m.9036 type:complete len:88 (+) Transcript_6673:200-463(+)